MPLLHRPLCPSCGNSKVRLVRSVGNAARLVVGVCIGFVLGDVVALRWRCEHDGTEFRALGSTPIDTVSPSHASN